MLIFVTDGCLVVVFSCLR